MASIDQIFAQLAPLLGRNPLAPDLRGTPGINPNAPDPRLPQSGPMGMPPMGSPMPGPAMGIPLPPSMNPNRNPVTEERKQEQRGGLLSPILSRLGPIGRGIDRFGGDLASRARESALSGSLGALAPSFQAGVLQADQNERQNQLAESRQQLIEAQIRGIENPTTNTNVQSTFRGQNGNMFIVTRNGETVDTGVQFDRSNKIFRTSDDRLIVTDNQGNPVREIDESQQSTKNLTERAEETTRATQEARADVVAQTELPEKIAKDQEFIDRADKFVKMLENDELETGPFVGRLPALTTNAQLFDAFSGENIIESISSATFGQLSEGERKFIATTNPNRRLTEEANIDIIKRKVGMIRRAQERAKGRLGRAEQDESEMIDFNDLPDA